MGIQASMNGLMRAVESNAASSNRRKPNPLLFGVAVRRRKVDALASITGGTAGFPVPDIGAFFVFRRKIWLCLQDDGKV